jgi:site-specific recombinase XerD
MVNVYRHRSPLHEYIAEMRPELGAAQVRAALASGRTLPAILSRPEVMDCIQAGKTPRNRLVVRVLYSTGVRIQELEHFRVADIGYDERVMFVREGKGHKDRRVCVDAGTLSALRDYTRAMAPEASLFGLSRKQLYRVVRASGEALGLVARYAGLGRRFSPHAFRHSYATHCYENGMDPLALKKLLGHEYLATTELYVEVSMASVHALYERTHPLTSRRTAKAAAGDVPILRLRPTPELDESTVSAQYGTCHELARTGMNGQS